MIPTLSFAGRSQNEIRKELLRVSWVSQRGSYEELWCCVPSHIIGPRTRSARWGATHAQLVRKYIFGKS